MRSVPGILALKPKLKEFNGSEKIVDLPAKLTTLNAPEGFRSFTGGLALYAPGRNLVIFYQDFGFSNGLIYLGKLDSIEGLSERNNVEITIETIK